jgi:diguanylate cyclase (GGDEF)-like protein/PAS domain S-box-containing protein
MEAQSLVQLAIPVTPVTSVNSVTSYRRRSERVSIAFAVEVAGTDVSGHHFSDRTKTTTVSRYGCCVSLPHVLQNDQSVHLRRVGSKETVVGKVVSLLGAETDGHLYGVALPDSCDSLWGIQFTSLFSEKVIEDTHEGVYFVNRDRKITSWNDGAEQLTGFTAAEAVGRRCFDNFLGHVDEIGRPLCVTGCPLASVMRDGQPRTVELFLQHKLGHRVPVTVRALPVRNARGNIVGAVELFSHKTSNNIVEKRVTELEHLAFRDGLTALPNRRFLEMKVEQALQEHQRFGRLYGLLMFDLDHFKKINDNHGHDVGDAMLKAVAKTLVQGQRPIDIIGRWGGEEFLVLMPDLDAVALGDLAERCRTLVAQSSVITGTSRVAVTASIGATVLNHADSAMSAIRRVDELMYQSKHSGGDQTTAG